MRSAWLGNCAQWGSVIVAAIGLFFIWLQVGYVETATQRAEKSVREGSARALYLSAIEAGYRHPEFLLPDLASLKKDKLNYARYEQYVGHLLYAYDELLTVLDDVEWRATFALEMPHHLDYLCTEWPVANTVQYFRTTRGMLRDLILKDERKNCLKREEWKRLSPPTYLPDR
jgi:hypothetical protein